MIPSKYLVMGGAIVALGLAVVLSNRPPTTPEGQLVATNADSYNQMLEKANQMVKEPLQKDRLQEPLTDEDNKNLKEAVQIIDSLSRYHSTSVITFLFAGKIYRMLGDTSVAQARFEQSIANAGNDLSAEGVASVLEAKFELSQLLLLQGKSAEAFKLADEVVKAQPNSAAYLTARASAETEIKKTAEAMKDVDAALKLDPDFRRAVQLKKLLSLPAKS